MKVALLNDQLNAGGAEKVLVNIANLLHQKGVTVMVVLFMQPSALDKQLHPGIPVFYLHRKGRFDLRAMRHLKQLVQHCDIVHVHSRYNLRYFMLTKYLLGIYAPKVVFHEHVPEYLSIDKITARLLSRTDAYVAVLQTICAWAKQGIVSSNKVYYLPNIVSAPPTEIHQNGAGPNALMIGNFRRVKNHLFAIQVIESLPAHFTLDLYGMVEDRVYFEELEAYIRQNNLQKRVRIIEGMNNVYDVLQHYNFALHTATLETGPLVLLEYMHAALPFVTHDTGDVPTNIKPLLPQLVLSDLNVESWKNRILNVMQNEAELKQVRQKMSGLINELYTKEKYWEQLKRVYNNVLSN